MDHYRPPEADVSGPPEARDGGGSLTSSMVESLRGTRPWVLFMGILTMIGCGFMVIVALVVGVLGGIGGMGEEFGAIGGVGLAVLYLLMAFLYFFPGLYLLRFGGAIKGITSTDSGAAVEDALKQQLAFWRFVGILAAAVMAIYVLIFIGAIFVGILANIGS